uniref:Uncharacterized protein n=1 Tax=Arundo donax TaxID=35708 RepID=A0A0A9HNN5_ARUDO
MRDQLLPIPTQDCPGLQPREHKCISLPPRTTTPTITVARTGKRACCYSPPALRSRNADGADGRAAAHLHQLPHLLPPPPPPRAARRPRRAPRRAPTLPRAARASPAPPPLS